MNTQQSNSGMPDLGSNFTGGRGISAAEVSAIVQAQLAYMQSVAGNTASSSPDSNQHVIAGLSSILDSIGQAGTEGLVISMIGKAALGAYDIYRPRQESESAPAIDRKLGESADAKSREQINLRSSEGVQAKHFAEEEGALIEAQKKLNEGDTRAAETLQAKVMWMQEFERLKDAGAPNDKTAADGATERVRSQEKAQQDRHAQSYARLVSARDGATDSARVASAAHEDRLRHTPNISLDELRKDMNRNHTEATHAITRKNYSRK